MKKNTQTYLIQDFTQLIVEQDYPHYFTQNELLLFGKKRKKGSLAVRYFLKKMIIEKLKNNVHFCDIEILNNEYGKPVLNCTKIPTNQIQKIHFSLSHTKTMVAIILVIEDGF